MPTLPDGDDKQPSENDDSTKNMFKSKIWQSLKPILNENWDPCTPDVTALPQHPRRIAADLKAFYNDPPPDIILVTDSDNLLIAHAIIIGPTDTPYEGGFFYFYIKLPVDYPISPPKIKLMTTAQGTVRFNPNLYACGKVCLSILGTWSGPQWCPASTLFSVLLSIQSLMNDKPYHNEPGFEAVSSSSSQTFERVQDYNNIIRHETIRVAVIGMMKKNNLDTRNMPTELKEKITKIFKTKISFYEKVIAENANLHGTQMKDPFQRDRIDLFKYHSLKEMIDKLKNEHMSKGEEKKEEEQEGDDSDSSTE